MLPDFLIIGVQRGGTTSLYENLVKHSNIIPASTKEIHFFDLNFNKGVEWYESQFKSIETQTKLDPNKNLLTGEATPYYIFHPLALKRIASTMSKVRLIVLLRNPIDRAYSHYNYAMKLGKENLSFEEAIKREPHRLEGEKEKIINGEYSFNHQHFSYLSRGIYVEQLQILFKHFSKHQILIQKSEDFFMNPIETMENICKFLNVSRWEKNKFSHYNAIDYKRMNSSTRKNLIEYFRPHNEKLYKLVNANFKWEE